MARAKPRQIGFTHVFGFERVGKSDMAIMMTDGIISDTVVREHAATVWRIPVD